MHDESDILTESEDRVPCAAHDEEPEESESRPKRWSADPRALELVRGLARRRTC